MNILLILSGLEWCTLRCTSRFGIALDVENWLDVHRLQKKPAIFQKLLYLCIVIKGNKTYNFPLH